MTSLPDRWLFQSPPSLPSSRREEAAAEGPFALVATGSGSYAPRLAATLAVDLIRRHSRPRDEGIPSEMLAAAFHRAHAAIGKAAALDGEYGYYAGLSGTAAAVHLGPNEMWIVHVGDTRVYRIRSGTSELLTADHLLETHPWVLSQALGMGQISPTVLHRDVLPGDRVLVCSRKSAEAFGSGIADLVGASPDLGDALERLVAHSSGAIALAGAA